MKQEKNQKEKKEKGEREGAFLTFMVQKTGEAVVLDEMYQVRERRKVGKGGGNFNSHELHFLGDGDGTKVVVMHETHRTASSEQIRGLSSSSMNETTSPCKVQWDGFRVLNSLTWETMFEWNSYNHVKLAESTFLDGGIESLCSNPWPWDAMHMNAVDMNPHGDYYLSARHTDTIYKISGRDGSVIWRLNGRDGLWNDFFMEEDFTTGKSLRFSRQHHVRWRGENGTHEFISILDNAKGTDLQPATGENSRAIVLALYTAGGNSSSSSSSSSSDIMTASLISSINHPNGKGSYAPRRGNYQFLGTQQQIFSNSSSSSSSSNSWISWSEEALHTEHFPNGSIALQASLHANWLGTYRSYKFPWRGIPKEKPVVHSVGYLGGGKKKKKGENHHHHHHHYHSNNSSSSSSSSPSTNFTTTESTTIIHVSQNGATEISHWKLYKTIPSGNFRLFLCERPRQGFETQLAWKGFASYVIVEAVDFEGKVLATSEVVETKKLISKDDDGDDDDDGGEGLVMSGEVAEEVWWVQEKEREEREGEEERRKGEEEKSLGKGERNEGSGWWWWLSGAFSMVSDEADSTSTSAKQQEQQQLQLLVAGRRDCVFAFAGGILVAAMLVCVFGVIRLRRGRKPQVQFYQALGKDEDEDEE